jgi:MFS family permease
MRKLLALRDARLLVAGQAVSMFGDSAMFLVLGIWAKTLTGSSAAAGFVFFTYGAGALLGPLGGFVADRVHRRRLMIGADLALAAVVLLLLLVHGRAQLWLLYLVTALYALGGTVFFPARSALVKIMFPEELLADANAIFMSLREGLRLIAPLVGAGLFAVIGGGAVAVVDAATFVFSAVTLLLLRVDEPPPAPREEHWVADLTAGVRHIWRVPSLRLIVLAVAGAMVVIGFAETVIFTVLSDGLHRPASFFGVLSSLQGAGSIVGAVTAAGLLRRIGDARLVGLGLVGFALGDLTFVSSSLPLVLLGFAVAGLGVSWAIVAFVTALQLRSPLAIQGRVSGAADTVIGLPQTLSIALGAGLSTVVDYRILVLVMAIVVALSAVPLLRARAAPEAAVAPAR